VRRYYPEAEEVYGKDVEAMVQDEDTMPIEQPIIQPIKEKQFDIVEANAPVVNYKKVRRICAPEIARDDPCPPSPSSSASWRHPPSYATSRSSARCTVARRLSSTR
jgi:hypothetical protein